MSPNRPNRPQPIETRNRIARQRAIAWDPSTMLAAPPSSPLQATRLQLARFCEHRPAIHSLLAAAADRHHIMRGGAA